MTDDKDSKKAADFAAGAQEGSSGLMSEFFAFLKHNKKWWLLPILLVIVYGLLRWRWRKAQRARRSAPGHVQ